MHAARYEACCFVRNSNASFAISLSVFSCVATPLSFRVGPAKSLLPDGCLQAHRPWVQIGARVTCAA